MKIKEFLNSQRNLGRVVRFSAHSRINDENVAEHSYHVTFYAMLLADLEKRFGNKVEMEKLLRASLLHDLEESLTGDILHDFKHRDVKLTREIKRMGLQFFMEMMDNLPENLAGKYTEIWKNAKDSKTIEGKILEAADRLDALLYSIDEYNLGNKKFRQTADKIVRDLKSMGLKSVDLVLEELEF
jgi:putative hydrolase of HD superfamily